MPNHVGAGGGAAVGARQVRRSRRSKAEQPEQSAVPRPTDQPPSSPSRSSAAAPAPERLRTVHETSAGGLVIDGIDGPEEARSPR